MDVSKCPEFDGELLRAVNQIAEDLLSRKQNALSDRITTLASPDEASTLRRLAIPTHSGRRVQDVLDSAQIIFANRSHMDHPLWFGFIPSPAPPVAWLGEVLNSAFNTHAGSWFQSSGPSAIEDSMVSWLAAKAGFPSSAGGCFVSGGSMANLTGLMLARDKKLKMDQRHIAVAYVSDQTHSSVANGMRIIGFRPDQVRKIRSDVYFRIDIEELTQAIKDDRGKGNIPFLIVGSCGTTNTGSIDPLEELADLAQAEDMWLHIDGAYGASVALSKSRHGLVKGLGRADSLSWDAHKWLFQTYGCGIVLARQKTHLIQSFAVSADYLQDAVEATETPNFWNFGPELTRPARAMKLWFTLQVLGLDALGRMIDHGFELAERAEAAIRRMEDWQVISPPTMAIVNFRYAPEGFMENELDQLNSAISRKAVTENIAGALTTKVRGKTVLRICSLHPELKFETMDEAIRGLDSVARSIRSNMPPQNPR